MENSTKFTITILSIFLLFGCGPSPEEIAEQERLAKELEIFEQKKDEVKVLYETLLSMSEEQPCNNMEEFINLSELEKNYGTKLFNEITKDRISFYSNECEKYKLQRKKEEVLALHDEIILNMQDQKPCINLYEFVGLQELDELNQTYLFEELTQEKIDFYSDECEKYTELNSLGDWIIGTTYDDFGDPIGKSININTRGTFSNSATPGSNLKVILAYSFNSFTPTFYLYEYGRSPVTSYSGYSYENIMDCRYRDSNNDNNWIDLHQYANSEYLFIGTKEKQKEGSKKLKKLIESGQEVRFVCSRDGSKYKFKFNFKYAENVKRKYNEWLESNN